MSNMLTAEAILGAKDFEEQTLSVPEWGGSVVVRTLSMGGRYTINERAIQPGKGLDHAKFASGTLEFGLVSPKLTREQAEKLVAEHPLGPIERICAAIWKLSGMGVDDAKNE